MAYLNDDQKTSKHIKEYLNDLQGNSTFTDSELLKLKRKPFAAYLHIKMMQLKSEGVDCWLEIGDYAVEAKIKDSKLVEAVGILIDNAWEATDDLNKDVIVKIVKQKDGRTAIEVMNKYRPIRPREFDEIFTRGYSTKGTKRGIGLYHLEQIITENNCELVFENRKINGENYVCFTLIL